MVSVQAKALSKALREQQLEFLELRKRELREAEEIQQQHQKNERKLVIDLKKANDLLKQDTCASKPVNPSIIQLLNDVGGTPTA